MEVPSTFLSLQLPAKPLIKTPPGNTVEVKRDSNLERTIFVRNNRMLLIYERTNDVWSEVHRVEDFFSVATEDVNYLWEVYTGGLVTVRQTAGIVVYQWKDHQLKKLVVASKYHDEYGYNAPSSTVLMGKIFPSDAYIGVVSRLNSSTVEFRSIDPKSPRKPVRSLKKKLTLDDAWKDPANSISLVEKYDSKAQLSIALRTASELKLYRFDEQYNLKELATVKGFPPLDTEYDRIMFVKIDHGSNNDLLHFSTQGLTMYRVDEKTGMFEKVYYSTTFSKLRGWNRRTIQTITTVDIDNDNRDGFICSGPRGLTLYRPTFTDTGFDLMNVFDEAIEDRTVRYGLPRLVIKTPTPKVYDVLLLTGEQLVSVQTKTFTPTSNAIPLAETALAKPEPAIPIVVPQQKYIVWLHDQLDLNSMVQPLNPQAGTVELSIPLIELPNPFGVSVRKSLQYKNIPFQSFFGRGWSLPLDYISVERKNSAFPQDHDYAVLKNNNRILLKRYPPYDNGYVAFIIEGYKSASVKYFPGKERWEMTLEDRTFVYGTWENLSKIRQEKVCATWPLCGSQTVKDKDLPSRWYLVHEQSAYGPYANYYYDAYDEVKGDRLKRIELDNGSNAVLTYTSTSQLASFTVSTASYEQNIFLEYNGDTLAHIRQEDRTLFKFEYANQRMSKIVFPNRLETTLEYSELAIDRTRFEEVTSVDLSPTIYYGPDYTAILDKEYEDDRVVLSVRSLLGGMDGPKVSKGKLHFGQPGIKSQTIHALDNLLVLVLIYGSQKEVSVLQYIDHDWVEKEYIRDLPLDAIVGAGKKFVVLCDLKTVRVLTIGTNGKLTSTELHSSVPANFLLHTFVNGIVMFMNEVTVWTLGQKDQFNKGTSSLVQAKDVFDEMENILQSFDVDAEFRTALRKGFLADALTVYQNAIVLRVPMLVDQKLQLKMIFLIMNYDTVPRVVSSQVVHIPIADLKTYEYSMPTKDGDVFKLYYVLENKKFILKLRSMTGPLVDSLEEQRKKSYKQIDDSRESKEKKAQYKKEVDEKIVEEEDNIRRTVINKVQFAMDLSQFGVLSNQHGIVTGNTQLAFNGQTWTQSPIEAATMRMEKVDQMLGAGFKLVKQNHNDTFKVFEVPRNVMVFDTETNNPQELQIVAPRYVQVQPAKKPLRMFFFKTREIVQMPLKETIVRASNTISLVTVRNVNETTKYAIFRPVDSFLLKHTTLFTKQHVRLNQEETRTTHHVYDAQDAHLSSEGAMFYKVKVVPGGDIHRYGWYEKATNPRTGETTMRSFSNDGTDVTVREKPKKENSESKDLQGVIWDKSKQLKIVELGAHKLSDESVSYYGFEPYELNQYGRANSKWEFDEKNVQSEHENHFLRLPARSSLKASFTPKEPKNMWIFSCWLRLAKTPKEEEQVYVVKVVMNDLRTRRQEIMSGAKVQHVISDWCYVELIVDATKTVSEPQQLTFEAIVDPSGLVASVDVDHVRFSPLGLNFRANIYTPVTAELRAVLTNNGMLKQSLYSPNGKRAVFMSENGQIVDFSMSSRIAYAAVPDPYNSLVEMKPARSEYETFVRTPWTPGLSSDWSVKYGVLEHKNNNPDRPGEIVRLFQEPYESVALRFLYEFGSPKSKLNFQWNGQEFQVACLRSNACTSTPRIGEVLLIITEMRVSIWLEGHLINETKLKPKNPGKADVFRLLPWGPVKITEFLVMYDSRVKVTYHNRVGRPLQVVEYDDPWTVRVREILYDDIDRPLMQTKWTKLSSKLRREFFEFYENFITQVDGASHQMHGMVAQANPTCDGFPYSHTIYANDPTENKQYQGLPGKDYSVRGKYRRRYAMRPEIQLLSNLFPEADGFRQKIVERPGGAIRATVEDKHGNKAAKYWQVGNYEHRLTTYEYSDVHESLERVLPPQYHSLAKTTSRTRPFLTGGDTLAEIGLKQQWEVSYSHEDGQITKKRTPDGGSYEYLYTEAGILRFTLHFDREKRMDRAIHFTYASDGKVMREALVNLTQQRCYELLESTEVPDSDDLIESFYGEMETNPAVRYRSQQSTRKLGATQMMESLIYDEHENVVKKVFFVPTINTTYSVDYEYGNGNLRSLRYPIDSPTSAFKLIYDYNGHGEVKSIRESTKRDPMFEFTYNADGMMETMMVRTDAIHSFQRNFTYNEPGFLVKLQDDYLTERISYVETDSYGQDSYTPIYEGLITRTSFTAHWTQNTSPLRNGIYPEYFITTGMNRKRATLCHDVLKRAGYLDENNLVNRTFYGEREDELPFVCGRLIPMNHLSEVLSSKSFPHEYGHRYDYDDHDQLIKAKYFHGLDELNLTPLTHLTFSKDVKSAFNEEDSKNIWKVLHEAEFLTLDCTNPNLCHGRKGVKSIFIDYINQHRFSHHLKTALLKAIADRKTLKADDFENKCKRWIEGSNMIMKTCTDLKESLRKQNIVGDGVDNPLNSLQEAFKTALAKYKNKIPDIVRVLGHHFTTALGRSAGDVQSYEIDANGNHRKFYTGFSRYRLEYHDGTNKIRLLHRLFFDRDQRSEDHFSMVHNSDGAVVKAEHKGIQNMEYDKILHRVTKIEMTDGRKLLFQYDVRAERTFKQVLDKDGKVMSEKYYIRDANGLVLVDMDMTYLAKDQPPDVRVTSYIYKDQQLVGFVRNDKLYGVITDHEGSVRLVVRDGEVVAAYDYLPYGQIFRRFGTDLDGQISYLYTSQEWEPETGLYNYRARLYDPDIGRFYQMDPKEQYPSPYVYAGNSPVSLVDPDGEFAFALAVLILALVGAYLGAASANNCWNPLKWDWRSTSTWLGLLTGAVTGASLPFNMASSVAFFVGMGLSLSTSIAIMVGTGITFAYFTMAASSGTWDPTKFDYSSPGTWNALMNGVATSSWILMNPSSLISSFATLSTVAAKALFFVAKLTMSLGFTYLFAALGQGGEFDVRKWDFSDPALYMSIIDGFTTATVGVVFLRNIPKQINKWSGKVKRTVDLFVGNLITFRAQLALGRDWSSLIKHTSNFLYVNFRNTQSLQKGLLTVGFYSLIVSLRLSSVSSDIPEFTVAESTINVLFTTEQFSDFIVKPLSPKTPQIKLPKPPNVARSVRFRIRSADIDMGNTSFVPLKEDLVSSSSSSASTMGNVLDFVFKRPFEWLFGSETAEDEPAQDTRMAPSSHQPKKASGSGYALKNCYKIHNDQHPDGMISCYGHSSTVTIVPKIDRTPFVEELDHFKYCLPLTYDGHPSVSCDGEWSSLVYTAKETSRVFDFVDGWILLAQVAPAAYREIKRGIKFLFSRPTKCRQPLDEDCLESQILHRGLDKLNSHIATGEQRRWAQWAVEDLTEDVETYLTTGRGSFSTLAENINALQEELNEDSMMGNIRHMQRVLQEQKEPSPYGGNPSGGWTSLQGVQALTHLPFSAEVNALVRKV